MKEDSTVTGRWAGYSGEGWEGKVSMKGVLLELKQGTSFVKRQGKSVLEVVDKQGATAKVTGKNEPSLFDDGKRE